MVGAAGFEPTTPRLMRESGVTSINVRLTQRSAACWVQAGILRSIRPMHGLRIIARSISVPTTGARGGKPFAYGNSWQYHSRSDRHSKICCWAILFDLMRTCERLRTHIAQSKVAIGINHTMVDFRTGRKKDLDLVVCTRGGSHQGAGVTLKTFMELVNAYTVELTDAEKAELDALPTAAIGTPSQVLIALEAKAAMTAFQKARPRLYDELNSSHLTVHGSDEGVIAAGFALVNVADSFISPDLNKWPLESTPPHISKHRQPRDAQGIVDKLLELPRRNAPKGEGYDAFGIGMVRCNNDGSLVTLVTSLPAPPPESPYNYEQFISRLGLLYATRFVGL